MEGRKSKPRARVAAGKDVTSSEVAAVVAEDEGPLVYYERVAEQKKMKWLKRRRGEGEAGEQGDSGGEIELVAEDGKRAVTYQVYIYTTVEPLIKDTLNKGHL